MLDKDNLGNSEQQFEDQSEPSAPVVAPIEGNVEELLKTFPETTTASTEPEAAAPNEASAETPQTTCCERDGNADGDCDRHAAPKFTVQSLTSDVPPPTVARMVHYVTGAQEDGQQPGQHRAAIVVGQLFENDGRPSTTTDLAVIFNGHNDGCHPFGSNMMQWRAAVPFDPTGLMPGSWHYPERV